MTRQSRRKADEAGSLSVETVMVVPVFLALFAFVLAVGTLQDAQGTMDTAVQSGARSASIARTAREAKRSARLAANVVLGEGGLPECKNRALVDPNANEVGAGLPQPPGKYINVVTVRGRCDIPIDFGLFSLTKTVSSHFTSVVDGYRGH